MNARFERKVELLMGGRHRPSFREVKNLLTHLANLSWRWGGGERGDVEVGERGLREVQAEGRVWVWKIEGSTAPGDTSEDVGENGG